MKRSNLGRDAVAAVLLLAAPLFPWNLYFGVGIPHSRGVLFAALATVTVLSLSAIVLNYAAAAHPTGRLRLTLNAPYALLVAGFVGFDLVQTVRYGGSGNVPGGVGPGAWLGIGGAVLSAQPAISGTAAANDDSYRKWLAPARTVGYASITLAALSVLFNMFWRIKAALPVASHASGSGKLSASIIATALVYGAVALFAVIMAARWILQSSNRSSRLATIALGVSTLAAGISVWTLPIGREIDGFHGIAQNTSTSGVGFEGYVAWVVAAAIFGPTTLLRVVSDHQIDRGIWRAAARRGLSLIAVWCIASVLMRATDVVVAAVLQLSRSSFDSAAMAAFDVVTAALAIWLRINLVNRSLPVAVISSLCGVLFVLSVSRIVIGIALAPRVAATPAPGGNAVYGNDLAQQITSTFDVSLSGLALCILVAAVVTTRFVQQRPRAVDAETTQSRVDGAPPPEPRQPLTARPRIQRPREAPTSRMTVGPSRDDPTRRLDTPPPRIFRSEPANRVPKIHRAQPVPQKPPGPAPNRPPRG